MAKKENLGVCHDARPGHALVDALSRIDAIRGRVSECDARLVTADPGAYSPEQLEQMGFTPKVRWAVQNLQDYYAKRP